MNEPITPMQRAERLTLIKSKLAEIVELIETLPEGEQLRWQKSILGDLRAARAMLEAGQ